MRKVGMGWNVLSSWPHSLLPHEYKAYKVCVEERARTWLEPHAIWVIFIIELIELLVDLFIYQFFYRILSEI